MYVDSHVHLSHRLYDGQFPCLTREQGEWRRLPEETREGLVEALREAGVTLCLEPGIDLASLDRLMALAERWPDFLLPAVAERIAELKGVPPQTVAEATAANARRLFCPEGDRDGVLSL